MRKMKKIAAMLLALAMVLGMSMTTMAAPLNEEATGTVTITGISGTPNVTLYRVAKAEYVDGLFQYTWAEDVNVTKVDNAYLPTAEEITLAANGLVAGTINPLEKDVTEAVGETYTKKVEVGAYIAVITGATDGSVYNPVFLTVSYDPSGVLVEGTVELPTNYTYGTTAVAKKTNSTLTKEIKDGTTTDTADFDKETASVGDVITYEVEVVVPSYPVKAVNKTFYISDRMSDGLTFDFASLELTIDNVDVVRDGNSFKVGEKVIANAAKSGNGFNLSFVYDNLIIDDATGAVYQNIIATYDAVIDEDAVVGEEGNVNTAHLYYTNTPNKGKTHDDLTTPPTGEGIVVEEEEEVVYTYQLSFLKTGEDGEDEDTNPDPLAGAVFGIYADQDCTKLIDTVTTNANGYAVSTNVASGTYYIKELVAPAGYSLNTTVYPITANWTSAKSTVSTKVTDRTYTTVENGPQVGWLDAAGEFYALDEFSAPVENEILRAYIESTSTVTNETTVTVTNSEGKGTVSLDESIPNTKIVFLPSTGGIGTTIFTVAGCGIMIAAAYLFFNSRRREEA